MKVTCKISKPSQKTWKVKGKTLDELVTTLDKHDWWGRYRSEISYSYKEKGGTVSVFSIKAKPVIHMPAWGEYSKASKDDKKAWDTMFKALLKHETNHHALFLEACAIWARDMDAEGEIDKKAALKAWKDFETNLQKTQDDYDSKTNHGAKEGVML